MTTKTVLAARRIADAARRSQVKLKKLAEINKEAEAAKLVAEAVNDAKEAAEAAAEVEVEAQRQLQLQEKLAKEDPTLWERLKKWV